jgi:uncharacterized protein (TIGR02246 family)
MLLALLREAPGLIATFLRPDDSVGALRRDLENRTARKHDVRAAVDMPLSNECKQVLQNAGWEAELLSHRHVETHHLLLGLLKVEKCVAAEILHSHGLDASAVREKPLDPDSIEPGAADIRHLIHQLITAWNGGVARRFAVLFTPNANYVTGRGVCLEGRDAIEEMRDSAAELSISLEEMLSSQVYDKVATALFKWVGQAKDRSERRGVISLVALNENGLWLIERLQNTDVG